MSLLLLLPLAWVWVIVAETKYLPSFPDGITILLFVLSQAEPVSIVAVQVVILVAVLSEIEDWSPFFFKSQIVSAPP